MPFSFKPTQVGEVPQAEPIIPDSAPISTPETKESAPSASVNQSTPPNPNPVPTFATQNRIVAPIPLGTMPLTERLETKKIGLFQIILYAIFGITLLTTVILFGYQFYLNSSIADQKKLLDDKDSSLVGIKLDEMRALSNRIKVVSQVLSEHASVSTAFLILEKSIENPITYKSFDLKKNAINKNYDLKINGLAPSYKAIAQQLDTLNSDEFSKDYISSVNYDSISLDPSGKVTFNLIMVVNILGKLPESIFTVSKIVDTTTIATTTPVVPSVATSTMQNSTSTNSILQKLKNASSTPH